MCTVFFCSSLDVNTNAHITSLPPVCDSADVTCVIALLALFLPFWCQRTPRIPIAIPHLWCPLTPLSNLCYCLYSSGSKTYLSLSVHFHSYFIQNKVPWEKPEAVCARPRRVFRIKAFICYLWVTQFLPQQCTDCVSTWCRGDEGGRIPVGVITFSHC